MFNLSNQYLKKSVQLEFLAKTKVVSKKLFLLATAYAGIFLFCSLRKGPLKSYSTHLCTENSGDKYSKESLCYLPII